MKSHKTPLAESNENKLREFGVGFWLILLPSIVVTAAVCVEYVQPDALSQMADEITLTTKATSAMRYRWKPFAR
jgi:hypothetical protein